jgi:hypothetical protein
MVNLSTIFWTVTRLAMANPDTKYKKDTLGSGPNCKYAAGECSNGTVGCIIGQALKASGVTLKPEWDTGNGNTASAIIDDLIEERIIEEPEQTGRYKIWLDDVQGSQDTGDTWQEALNHANRRMTELLLG